MELEQNRFLQQQQPPAPRRKRWGGCLAGLSCFRKRNGGKRIVPSSRIPEANALPNQPNRPQAGGFPQATGIALSYLAPPSSPASFSNSALPSTAQSPNCFLSANSPENPSSNMYVMGPYAHETQLVSPPVFSTFTTEPSTAPLTPPPELAHLTTPSSPDVPYARFLLSSANIKSNGKNNSIGANDLQATYSLDPGSPSSALRSPVYTNSESGRFIGLGAAGVSKSPRQDSNFFCPETFAQFYVDQSSFGQGGGRLSISRETDAYSNGGNGHQNRPSKTCKPDAEELEAYRASFGFSADEIITTTHYVEISDVLDDSFSMAPLTSDKPVVEENIWTPSSKGVETEKRQKEFPSPKLSKAGLTQTDGVQPGERGSFNYLEDQVPQKRCALSDDDGIYSKMGSSRNGRKYHLSLSNSDTEIEYRRNGA